MKVTTVAVALLMAPFCSVASFAQGDPMAMMHQMAANQLGLLEYCKAQGAIDDAPLAAQKEAMAQLPPATGSTDTAEQLGKQGTLSVNGTTMTLASAASSKNVTVDGLCKQMGTMVVQTAAMMKQGAMPPAK